MNCTKIDANRLEHAARTTSSPPLTQPDKETVDSFKRSLHDHPEQENQEHHGTREQGSDNTHTPSSMARMHELLQFRTADQQTSPGAPGSGGPDMTTTMHPDSSISPTAQAMPLTPPASGPWHELHAPQPEPQSAPTWEKGTDSDSEQATPQPPADSIASLFSQRIMSMPESQPLAEPASHLPASALDTLVDQILVGRNADGGHEVRLHLDPKILPGTEVHIQHSLDGSLHVRLISNNASSFQTLVSSQDILQQRLESSGSQVRVTVSSEAEAENNDQRRRSRGYISPTDETPS